MESMEFLPGLQLIFLLESALYLILERNKLKSLNLEILSEDEKQIYETLKVIEKGIRNFEEKLSIYEENTNISTKELKQQEDILIRLKSYYERLREILESGSTKDYELISDLTREGKEYKLENKSQNKSISEISPEPCNTLIKNPEENKIQILKTQKQIMDEQDMSLNSLYNSISLQKKLTVQMESELEQHNEFLEEMEVLVDRSQKKIGKSSRNLEEITKNIKENSKYY
ncbi:hypothetical protein PCANB_001587 [Pneumocystis canis]|nr:hypothetical protein PCANB_001587 [Pneumocystis canis]